MTDIIQQRYLKHAYLAGNPTWDQEDSPWKADRVASILMDNQLKPKSICEVGCGAGGVLGALQTQYPDAALTGYDIAPDAAQFWSKWQQQGIDLHVGDFFACQPQTYDVLLLLDVLEHVADPHQFLEKLKPSAPYVVLHFPLDLSAFSVLRQQPLLYVRRKVGHIHFFTKDLALELMAECGYEVLDAQYTNAALSAPQRNLKTRLFGYLRQCLYWLNKDIAVRLIGGETLMLLARPKNHPTAS